MNSAIDAFWRERGISTSQDETINPALQDFYNRCAEKANAYERSLNEASAIDEGLKPEVREQRQSEIIGKAHAVLVEAAEAIVQPYLLSLHHAEREIQKKAMPQEKDNLDRLYNLIASQNLLSQIQSLPMDKRAETVLALADSGNPLLLSALSSSIVQIVNHDTMQAVQRRILERTAGDEIAMRDRAQAIAEEVSRFAGSLNKYAMNTAKKMNLEKPYTMRHESAKAKVKTMTEGERAKFITENGLDAFKKLVAGEV